MKQKLGRGFTLKELVLGGVHGQNYARSLGIAIDLRRKDTCSETLNVNGKRIKDYVSSMILAPRRGKYEKKPQVKEANKEVLSGPEASFQNTTRSVVPLPKKEPGYTWTTITKGMTGDIVYKTLRKETKTARGFYKRMELIKAKAKGGKK